jgi:hypothetical protein
MGMTRGLRYPVQPAKTMVGNPRLAQRILRTYHLKMTTLIWCILRTGERAFQMKWGLVNGFNPDSGRLVILAIFQRLSSEIGKTLREIH